MPNHSPSPFQQPRCCGCCHLIALQHSCIRNDWVDWKPDIPSTIWKAGWNLILVASWVQDSQDYRHLLDLWLYTSYLLSTPFHQWFGDSTGKPQVQPLTQRLDPVASAIWHFPFLAPWLRAPLEMMSSQKWRIWKKVVFTYLLLVKLRS